MRTKFVGIRIGGVGRLARRSRQMSPLSPDRSPFTAQRWSFPAAWGKEEAAVSGPVARDGSAVSLVFRLAEEA